MEEDATVTPAKDKAPGAPEMTGHHVPSDLGEEARQTSVAGPVLVDLLARVEAAEGPDRELDALIMCELVAGRGAYVEQSKINMAWCIYYAPNRIWSMSSREGTWREGGWPLTASLDAALALCERVLPGHRIELSRVEHGEVGDWVWVGKIERADFSACWWAKLKTPALALLAAMLRALIAQAAAASPDKIEPERDSE